jgi:hypothetical protein
MILQSLNPLYEQQARKDLCVACKEKPQEMMTVENALFVHRLLATCPFPPESRRFLVDLFAAVPLMKMVTVPVDEKVAAECTARLLEAQLHARSGLGAADLFFSDLPIPKYSTLADVLLERPKVNVPEVYLDDSAFERVLNMDRGKFYGLAEDERNRIRISMLKQ